METKEFIEDLLIKTFQIILTNQLSLLGIIEHPELLIDNKDLANEMRENTISLILELQDLRESK